MTSYEPDPKDAALFARHKTARKVIKDTRKPVMEAAERAMRGGASNQQLAEWTGLTAETFRSHADKLGIDNRQKAPTVGRKVQGAQEHAPPTVKRAPEPAPSHDLDRLTDQQAADLAQKAFLKVVQPSDYNRLDKATAQGDRAVIEAALNLGVLDQTDLLIA